MRGTRGTQVCGQIASGDLGHPPFIAVYNFKNQEPGTDPTLFGLTCFKAGEPKGCGWTGDLLASQGRPLPERQ